METRLEHVLKRYTSLSSAMDMLHRRKLTLLSPLSWQDKNDTEFMEAYRKGMSYETIHALCFTQAPETFHHWQVFAGNNEGVCIEFEKAPLLKKMDADGGFEYGEVQYLTLAKLKALPDLELARLPFLKRHGFMDEKEYRVFKCGHDRNSDLPTIDINFSWIRRITLNPWLRKNLAEGIKEALHRFPGCQKLKVVRSQLTDNASWQQEVNRVIQRMPKHKPKART